MMLVRLSMRLHRKGLIGCGALLSVFALAQGAGYAKVAGSTRESHLAFARQMEILGRQMTYMLPLPERIDTLAGFVQWRAFGFFPLIVAFWAVIAGAGATRGDEESGLTEQWLATGRSRARLLVARVAGFALVTTAVVAAALLAAQAGSRAAGESLPAGALMLQGAALVALTVCCFTLTIAMAQFFATRRGTAAAAGIALLVLFAVNAAGRSNAGLAGAQWISPFYYYDRVRALLPGGDSGAVTLIALVAASLVLTLGASLGFARRDLGASLLHARRVHREDVVTPSRNPLLASPALAALYEQRVGLAGWMIGSAAPAFLFASLARSVVDLLRAAPGMRGLLDAITRRGDPYIAYLGVAFFGVQTLIFALYAVTQVSRWVDEDLDGRLEMVLSAPISRRRVVVERFAAVLLATLAMASAAVIALALSARAYGLAMPSLELVLAGAMLVPLATSFAAVGALVASYAPRAAVPVLATFAVASYCIQQFGTAFGWPDAVMRLSVFQLYGAPLVDGINRTGVAAMVAVTLIGFAGAGVALQRRDLGR